MLRIYWKITFPQFLEEVRYRDKKWFERDRLTSFNRSHNDESTKEIKLILHCGTSILLSPRSDF